MLLDGVQIVLVKTRFPENIGMAARACANMGCPAIRLVDPERWDREKAGPLATPKGQSLLDGVRVSPDLAVAVAESSLVLGTTARTGGWRQALLAPGQAAREVAAALARDEKVSLVFGPEDRGLNNEEITHCQRLPLKRFAFQRVHSGKNRAFCRNPRRFAARLTAFGVTQTRRLVSLSSSLYFAISIISWAMPFLLCFQHNKYAQSSKHFFMSADKDFDGL